ncbi:mite group 2 allergen Tyr p 2-like [Oppia nitens]|uniref:mite group 2 allergen Tyr p 2-like n=1 Tax=Oppia nitens TaxID=1686743 RepID=UPI0023D9D437|nr:mite group 2 allergen Tyr p 2-like [Oppia nitens]
MSINVVFSLIIFYCLICYVLTIEWPFRDCGKHEIKSLRIEPCTRSPCKFRAGESVNITVDFVANQNTDNVKLYGSLRTGGMFDVEVPYLGIDENACNMGYNKNKLDCPLEKGKTYRFVLIQTVPYASRFNVFRYTTWRLQGSNSRDLTCAEFDIYQEVAHK